MTRLAWSRFSAAFDNHRLEPHAGTPEARLVR